MGMPHSKTWLCYHLVFATKNRHPFIAEPIERTVWGILWDICRANGLHPFAVGGIEDHIHVLVGIPATMCVADAARLIKGGSSMAIRQRFPQLSSFCWQNGYAALTFDYRSLDRLVRYVNHQREHHYGDKGD
ncbi:MAG: IS200/IS605 family transposase [Candidatus Kapabacteria bacterium]|nr:IS200/IS605 family transposase [Candidatus Kapabacteria bacterium]